VNKKAKNLEKLDSEIAKVKLKSLKKVPRFIQRKDGEVVFKLEKVQEDKKKFAPDLIFVDGGKGQLSSAKKVLDKLNIKIPLFSIAKKEEEIFTYKEEEIKRLELEKDSESLFLVQRLRDESHRFAISYNRNLREKAVTKSVFDDIPGIGPATKKKLIRSFGSASGVREASDDELRKFVSERTLKKIREHL